MPNRSGSRALTPAEQQLLAQPLTLPFSGRVIKNRFCKAALSESLARADGQIDHSHTNSLVNLYEAWAEGGSGLILTGNIMVDRLHREMEHNVAVEDERDIGRLKLWAGAVHKHGAALVAQISHPGRQSHGHLTKNPVAPSAVPVSNFHPFMTFAAPRALTEPEIKGLVQSFTATAVVLSNAGFDGIELHAAHGYLISQFLNPRTNIRTDSYGGSLENRARFISEIVQSIRAATPANFIVGVKLNSVDFGRRRGDSDNNSNKEESDNGVDKDLEEAVQVSVMLENLGVDFIEISGGSYESFAAGLLDGKGVPNTDAASDPTRSTRTRQREAHFAVFADKISSALTKTKVVLTGGFLSAVAMADAVKGEEGKEAVANGKSHIDMVGLGRTICQEPDLPNKVMNGSVTGALIMPQTPGGFMDIVFLCGGNLHRMAAKKAPVISLGGMLFSRAHYGYGFDYTKVGVHKIKTLVGC
ncbi:hypothetical protein MVEG_05161 [Podila verticillata NRRL 6337]|nr:hypothetical protein MVEG_05161 [Podila verticillata NRRL 6337]